MLQREWEAMITYFPDALETCGAYTHPLCGVPIHHLTFTNNYWCAHGASMSTCCCFICPSALAIAVVSCA